MVELGGSNIIRSMLKKWRTINIFSDFLISTAIACLISVLLFKTMLLPVYWGFVILIVVFIILFLIRGYWKITEAEIARFLNRMFPQMEESSSLLLKPYESLNLLEKMQVSRIERAINSIPKPSVWNKRFRFSWIMLISTLLMGLLITQIPFSFKQNNKERNAALHSNSVAGMIAEIKPASVKSVSIKIVPPAYTGKAAREQSRFNLQVEENAEVLWQVTSTSYVKELKFVFNDSSSLKLSPINKEHTEWTVSKSIKQTGFYQVQTEHNLSEFYKIETISDLPPVIKIKSPKSYMVIDFGQPQKVMLEVTLSDDYGVDSAGIVTTIASGSGERVKFKERQLPFPGFARGRQQYQLNCLIDLPSLGLEPGDELYYYVKARDNHRQENRSDIYIITIPDTAKLMSMDGMTGGVNLVPEYFRSQRQIIIETEQLLREKDTIPVQQFNSRSNNLGLDQQLLRLRYGKFLGEESENEVGAGDEGHDGHDDHNQKAHNDASDFGNAAAIIDAYTHKHDNAEDASFFEPELKAQLKATLSEMWKSELRLRTYKPREALPFEYKALRLLKDLQQKSRVYVAKTNVRTTPLKQETRLTGELGKIIEPTTHEVQIKNKDAAGSIIMAIPILENFKNNIPLKNEEIEILKRASAQLSLAGSSAPAVFLAPLAAMRRILENAHDPSKVLSSDIALAENAFQKILPTVTRLPSPSDSHPVMDLSRQYFRNLNKLRQ